ncbi:hypothetical protein D9611_002985 [Ephemerocybe angulata]|uniref:Uncharacterized protein n=1 Tax=Ephemerocybe angulata TaxID=980116 RepID=A0A8H5FHQ6_9AGAR|nr:hypothetical protein D9611_002985 [Tulosesus angulatus]
MPKFNEDSRNSWVRVYVMAGNAETAKAHIAFSALALLRPSLSSMPQPARKRKHGHSGLTGVELASTLLSINNLLQKHYEVQSLEASGAVALNSSAYKTLVISPEHAVTSVGGRRLRAAQRVQVGNAKR